MKEELHLFIIWSNGRYKQDEILEDMNKNFDIIKVYEIEWGKDNFAKNLSRFYGTNLPKNCKKEENCGSDKFLLIILKVKNPVYEKRNTTRGEEIVNIKMFDKKTEYRELTGGPYAGRVHGTNNENETNHDLTLLIGKNVEDFLKENKEICSVHDNKNGKWDGKIEVLKSELSGHSKWHNIKDMFYALNNCTNYAILRNYEALPNDIYEKDHNDIDIICNSLEDVKYILNAEPTQKEEYRVQYKVKVEDRIVFFDLRSIGDNYYYAPMEEKILAERVYNEKGFYTLNKENYFYSLLYHAIIQKLDFTEDYKKKLIEMNVEKIDLRMSLEDYIQILKKWMIKNEFIIVKPKDKSVIFNKYMVEYFEPLVYRQEMSDEQQNQIEELKAENEKQKAKIEELTSLLSAIQGSRAWKMTKPIRDLRKIFK